LKSDIFHTLLQLTRFAVADAAIFLCYGGHSVLFTFCALPAERENNQQVENLTCHFICNLFTSPNSLAMQM